METRETRDLDSSELLRSAARWLGDAQDAVAKSQWAQAETALKLAEATYASGSELTQQIAEDDAEALEMLSEGRALCTLLRSDIALRHWKLEEAEKHLDEAYEVLKQGEGLGVELWRLTARLAERRGRWTSAFAAWKKAAKTLEGGDEYALADAWIRLAEIGLIEGKTKRAEQYLNLVEPLARELDSELLRARTLLLRAGELESQQDFTGASDVYKDVEALDEYLPLDLQGLLRLRLAGTLVHGSPRKALRKLELGHQLLTEHQHPDAHGLTLSQVAILALVLKRPEVAALAAMSAEGLRGGKDGTSRPLLIGAVTQLGKPEVAKDLEDLDHNVMRNTTLARMLDPTIEKLKMSWDDIGKEASVVSLLQALRGIQAGRIQVRVEDAVVLSDANALFRQRATLTWDAPQGRLVTRLPPLPVIPKLIMATAPAAPARHHTQPPPLPAPVVDAPPMTMMRLGLILVFVVTFAFFLGVVIAAVVLQMLA